MLPFSDIFQHFFVLIASNSHPIPEKEWIAAQQAVNSASSEYLRAEGQHSHASNDLKRIRFIIEAHHKQHQSVLDSIKALENVFVLMKNEKTKATVQIHNASLRRGEMRSTAEVLSNESEV